MLFFRKKKPKVDLNKYNASLDGNKSLGGKLKSLVKKYSKGDVEYFNELEEILIEADVNVSFAMEIVEATKVECASKSIYDPSAINQIIIDKIFINYTKDDDLDTELKLSDNLTVFLIIGVNGVGKTTTIAKLAHYYKQLGKKVVLAAGDTFRAGAIEQLCIWADKIGVEVIKKNQGADTASVIFDAVRYCKDNGTDILICDTAGRLQTKTNLMAELSKIERVITKELGYPPQEVLLVIDGTTGQNGLSQANIFAQTCKISGIILTKMDGTSKGGIVLSIKEQFNLPVRFIGVGEKVEDLVEFDLESYLYALFDV